MNLLENRQLQTVISDAVPVLADFHDIRNNLNQYWNRIETARMFEM